MAAGEGDTGDELDHSALGNEGMQDPVVLRGLLQCIAIALFSTGRYVLDVLFTPHVVQSVPRQMLALIRRVWAAALCAPIVSLFLLHYWASLEYSIFSLLARWMLRLCILRSFVVKLLDDTMVVWPLKKAHIWVPLQCLVTFTRVSSGREPPRGQWRGGFRSIVCRTMPWVVRCGIFSATWSTLRVTPIRRFNPRFAPGAFEPDGARFGEERDYRRRE